MKADNESVQSSCQDSGRDQVAECDGAIAEGQVLAEQVSQLRPESQDF